MTFGCSTLEQNDLIEVKELSRTTSGTIIYKLYQTGIDNYRYEFYLANNADTTDIFQTYLNDATHRQIKFLVLESNDTVKIKSNRNLGQQTKDLRNQVFTLSEKADPFKRLGATVHSGQVTNLMLYSDSINSLSDLEISIHKKIWDIEEVVKIAKDLKTKNIMTFTMIEGYPNESNDYYTIRFGQVLNEDLPTILNFRVNAKSGQTDKMTNTGGLGYEKRLEKWHYHQQQVWSMAG